MPRLDGIRLVLASLMLLGLTQPLQSNPLPENAKSMAGDKQRESLPHGARARLNASLGPLSAVAFSPNGDCVAAGSAGGAVCLWNWQAKTAPRVFTGHKERVWSVAFSPDGQLLASAGNDGQVILWETATGQQARRLDNRGSPVYAVAFSPDGLTLASGSHDDYTRLWRVATGKELGRFGGPLPQELARPQVEAPRKGIMALAFSPDGHYLAAASGDQAIHLWDAAAGREERRFAGHSGVVVALGFSADGRTLASSATTAFFTRNRMAPSASGVLDGTVRLWEVASGQERCRFHGQQHSGNPMAFAPGGRLVAALDPFDRTIRLWDASTGELLDQYEGHGPMNRRHAAAAIETLAVSPTGGFLASGAGDGSVLVWNANARPQPAPAPNGQSSRLGDVLWWSWRAKTLTWPIALTGGCCNILEKPSASSSGIYVLHPLTDASLWLSLSPGSTMTGSPFGNRRHKNWSSAAHGQNPPCAGCSRANYPRKCTAAWSASSTSSSSADQTAQPCARSARSRFWNTSAARTAAPCSRALPRAIRMPA